MEMLGVNLNPGGKSPESNGVPRLFILDEEAPDKPRTLEESNVAIGSVESGRWRGGASSSATPPGRRSPPRSSSRATYPAP